MVSPTNNHEKNVNNNENENDTGNGGTFISAQFNLLSSMVGGGSLSLPLAFYDVGIGLSGPILVLLSSLAADYTIRMLIESSKKSPSQRAPTYESLVEDAFGSSAKNFCSCVVFSLCFITCIGYGIILRDLSSPLVHLLSSSEDSGPTLLDNGAMLFIILFITPLCCLKTLTALQNVGILSMFSVLVMGTCVTYRSIQCNFYSDKNHHTFGEYMTWSIWNFENYLNALPLIVSVFVCHFNVLPVYIELSNKSSSNVKLLVRSTMSIACLFYTTIGFWGSMYGNCLDEQKVSGNILLDFDDDDPLVLLARVCLGVTVICMYPMLVNPARNILMNILIGKSNDSNQHNDQQLNTTTLTQPLLENYEKQLLNDEESNNSPLYTKDTTSTSTTSGSSLTTTIADFEYEYSNSSDEEETNDIKIRVLSAILVLWNAAFIACFIKTLDTVWDLLGSSFSILVGYLLPCLVYIYITINYCSEQEQSYKDGLFYISILGVCVFTPMMILCTVNSIYNNI